MDERLWNEGTTICEVQVEKPLVAQWEAKDNPAQIRLNDYLAKLVTLLSPIPDTGSLFLHFEICVDNARKLLSGCDLENFLFPLFGRQWLPADRFVLVSARKSVGKSSSVRIGIALNDAAPLDGWFSKRIIAGSGSGKEWKERVRGLLAIETQLLEPGPAKVQIAFRCSPRRNWTNLWKSSGDAMGPILGTTGENGFNPCDDRIVELKFHKLLDKSLGNQVQLGYWWQNC